MKLLVLITQLLVISFGLVLALLKLEVFLSNLFFKGLVLFVQVFKLFISKLELCLFCSKLSRLELFGFELCLLGLDLFDLGLEGLDEGLFGLELVFFKPDLTLLDLDFTVFCFDLVLF